MKGNLHPDARAALMRGLEAIADAQGQGRVPWLCALEGCDGSPHKGRRGPHARPNQRPPGDDVDWDTWLLLAGRGFGKTRTGAEWAIEQAKKYGPDGRGALVGPTAADARDILVLGESGILACAPHDFRPKYEPSNRRLTYPNGGIQMVYSADEPDRLRGPQHHYGWADELAAWRRLQYAWDMLQMGMRLGDHPQVCVTTTPRPLPLVKQLVKDSLCYTVRGSTYDNLDNLAPTFRRAVVARYEGTTLGRQELDAEILDDMPGALLSRVVLERNRVDVAPAAVLRAVSVDPAGTGLGDETGLVAGLYGVDGHQYLTHDWSRKMTPRQQAREAWRLFKETDADVLVYEDNFGKGWVRDGFITAWHEMHGKDTPVPMMAAVSANVGKQLRAQPVVMRHEQDMIHHVGSLPELEDQYTTWIPEETPTKSPDRVDAAVHLHTYLTKRFEQQRVAFASPTARPPISVMPGRMRP